MAQGVSIIAEGAQAVFDAVFLNHSSLVPALDAGIFDVELVEGVFGGQQTGHAEIHRVVVGHGEEVEACLLQSWGKPYRGQE